MATPEEVKQPKALEPKTTVRIQISPPNMQHTILFCQGRSYLCINRFGAKALEAMEATQRAGSTAKSKRKRTPKLFEELFRDAQYRSGEGDWCGIHAAALRNACISACKLFIKW